MVLTVKFKSLDFYSYKFLIDALMNGSTKVSVYCNDLPEQFQEKNIKYWIPCFITIITHY